MRTAMKLDRRTQNDRAFRRSRLAAQCMATLMATTLLQPTAAMAADKTEVAISAVEFGGSIGKLLWVAVDSRSQVTENEANRYRKLAFTVKEQIELGRASSSLVKANFDVIATTLGYTAVVDPEPLSRAVASVAAWGAKKTGDA